MRTPRRTCREAYTNSFFSSVQHVFKCFSNGSNNSFVGLGSFWYGCNRKKKVFSFSFLYFLLLVFKERVPHDSFSPVCGVHASTTDDEFSSPVHISNRRSTFPFFSTIDEPNAMNGSLARTPRLPEARTPPQLVCGVCLDVGQRHGCMHADVALVLPRQGNSFLVEGRMDRKFLTRGSVKVALRRSSDTRNAKDGFPENAYRRRSKRLRPWTPRQSRWYFPSRRALRRQIPTSWSIG